MPEAATVAIVIKAKDEASKALGGIRESLGGLGKVAAGLGLGAAAGVGALAAGIGKLAMDAAELEPTRVTFENLAKSIGATADALLVDLRKAAMGMVTDAELMQGANKFMAMGLAESSEEAAKLTEMAVKLGMAMGQDAATAMADFAAMLANQSIPRLDNFGISSGKVRKRIEELMEATEGLTRDQAFMQAVMEVGAEAMAKMGDISGTSAATMAQLRATFSNIITEIGSAFIPILQALLQPLAQLAKDYGPRVTEWAKNLAGWLQSTLIPAIQTVMDVLMAFLSGAPGDFPWEDIFPPWLADIMYEVSARFEHLRDTIANFASTVTSTIQNAIAFVQPLLTSFLGWFSSSLPEMEKTTSGVFGRIQKIIQSVLGEVVPFVRKQIDTIVEWVQDNWPLIQKTVETVMNAVQRAITTILSAIQAFWRDHGQQILSIVQNVWNIIKATIETGINAVLGIIRAVMQLITGDWEGAWETIKGVAETVWTGIKTIVENLTEAIRTTIVDIFLPTVQAAWEKIWQAIRDFLAQKWEEMKAKVEELAEAIRAYIERKWEEARSVVQRKMEEIFDHVRGILRQIKDFISGFSLYDVGRDLMNSLKDGILSVADRIADAAAGVVRRAIEAAKHTLGWGHSSKVFIDMGRETMQSFAQGVEEGLPEAIEALTDALDGLVAAFSELAAAAPSFAGYEGLEGFKAGIDRLAEDTEYILRVVRERLLDLWSWAGPRKDTVWGHMEFWAGVVSDIVELIGDAVETFSKVGDYAGIMPGAIDRLAADIEDVLERLARIAEDFEEEALEHAALFAEAAGKMLEIVGTAIQALTSLSEWVPHDLAGVLTPFEEELWNLLVALGELGRDFMEHGLELEPVWAEAAQTVLRVVTEGVEALLALGEWKPRDLAGALSRFEEELWNVLVALDQLGRDFMEHGLELEPVWAEAAQTVLGVVRAGIDALTALGEWEPHGINRALARFKAQLTMVLSEMGALAAEFAEAGLERVAEFAGAVADIMENLAAAIGSMGAIGEFEAGDGAAAMRQATSAVLDWLADLIRIVEAHAVGFYHAGVGLIRGLIEGLASGASALYATVMAIVENAIAVAMAAAGASSPSRVMAELGKNMALGLVAGLEAGQAEVARAMTALVAPPALTYAGVATPLVRGTPPPPAGGTIRMEIPIYLDGREIARVVDERLAERLRREGIVL